MNYEEERQKRLVALNEDCKKQWETLKQAYLNGSISGTEALVKIREIDEDTPYITTFAPDWWCEMIKLEREILACR